MGGPAYNNQFISHSGPRGPPGMAPGGMGPGPGPNRGPPSMGPMYGPTGGPQRVPQHPNYGPSPQQAHMRPPQGIKRPYNSEVRDWIWVEPTGTKTRRSDSDLPGPLQSFSGMSQQYGVPVASGGSVMSGPGGTGSMLPGQGAVSHGGQGPFPGPNMQYHPGEVLLGGVSRPPSIISATHPCRLCCLQVLEVQAPPSSALAPPPPTRATRCHYHSTPLQGPPALSTIRCVSVCVSVAAQMFQLLTCLLCSRISSMVSLED